MSLVNDIYKDLQNRNKTPLIRELDEDYFAFPKSLLPNEHTDNTNVKWMVILGVLFFFALTTSALLWFRSSKMEPIHPPLSLVSSRSEWIVSQPILTTISGASVAIQQDATEFTVFLSHVTPYTLRFDDKKRVLQIAFDEAVTSFKKPNLNLSASAIEWFKWSSIAKNRPQLELKLLPDVDVESVNMVQQEKQTVLTIVLKSSVPQEKSTYSVKSSSAEHDVLQFYNQALSDLQNGAEQKGVERLQYLLSEDPGYELARKALAAYYLKHKNTMLALDVIEAGLAVDPASKALIMLNAEALMQANKNQQAVFFLLKNENVVGKENEFYMLLAEAYSNMNKWNRASDIYQLLTEKHPSNGNYWFLLGESYLKQNKMVLSKQAFQKALESDDLDDHIRRFLTDELG